MKLPMHCYTIWTKRDNRLFELIVSWFTLSEVQVVAHLPAWSYCSQRSPTATAEAWERQIRYMQLRNHSNKGGKSRRSGKGVRGDYAPRSSNEGEWKWESLVENTNKGMVLSIRGRERWHGPHLIFTGGKSNWERNSNTPGRIKLGKEPHPVWKDHWAPLIQHDFYLKWKKKKINWINLMKLFPLVYTTTDIFGGSNLLSSCITRKDYEKTKDWFNNIGQ